MKRFFAVLLLSTSIVILYMAWNLKDQFWNMAPSPSSKLNCSGVALVNDMGRMGNKFFELLAARILSERWNLHLCITSKFAEAFVWYFSGFSKKISVQRCRRLDTGNFTDVHLKDYDPSRAVDCNQDVQISGFPLDIPAELWREIFSRQKELAAEFRWQPQLVKSIRMRMSQWTENGTRPAVGIHVRRKDYERHLNSLFGPSRLAGVDYFRRAMDHFRRNYKHPAFLVVSNDMSWCEDNLIADDVIFAGRGWEEDPGWDLAILSSCDHLILTYGTYGMMAAYFTTGQVITAYNFTSQVNNLVERVKSLDLPNWHWFAV